MTTLETSENSVVVIGGLLVDDIAISKEYLRAGSSNPVRWQHKLGGVATNVARVVSQQLNTLLIANTGDDNHSHLLTNLLAEESMSSALVVWENQSSDRYTAVLDHDGTLYLGLADTQLAERMQWSDVQSRLPTARPSAVVIDANLSKQCLNETVIGIGQHYESKPLIVGLAVSPIKSIRLLPVANAIDVFLCNRQEAAALSSLDASSDINALADGLLAKSFKQFVITDAGDPILVQDNDARFTVTVPSIEIEASVNGAGDALSGATILALVNGMTLHDAVRTAGLPAARSILSGNLRPPNV